MDNQQRIIEDAKRKVAELFGQYIREMILEMLQGGSFCEALEKMGRRPRARCELAMNAISKYTNAAENLLQREVERSFRAIAALSVWPQTAQDVSPEDAIRYLSEFRDEAISFREGTDDIDFAYMEMIDALIRVEELG